MRHQKSKIKIVHIPEYKQSILSKLDVSPAKYVGQDLVNHVLETYRKGIWKFIAYVLLPGAIITTIIAAASTLIVAIYDTLPVLKEQLAIGFKVAGEYIAYGLVGVLIVCALTYFVVYVAVPNFMAPYEPLKKSH